MKSKVSLLTAIFILFAAFSAHAFSVEGKIVGIEHWEGSGKVFLSVERTSDQVIFKKSLRVTGGDFTFTNKGLAMGLTSYSLDSVTTVEIQNGVIIGIVMK